MTALRKLAAVLLIAGGVIALVYKSFEVPTKQKEAQLGPLKFSVEKTEKVTVPVWAGVLLIAGGAVLLLVGKK